MLGNNMLENNNNKQNKRIRMFEESDLFIIGQLTANQKVTPAPKVRNNGVKA
jgi:hypothetical protein